MRCHMTHPPPDAIHGYGIESKQTCLQTDFLEQNQSFFSKNGKKGVET